MSYRIIATGSKGNALYVEDGGLNLLVDCGVSFKALDGIKPDAVLLTHEHSDHFNVSTLKRISREYPLCVFLAPQHLYLQLIRAGIPKRSVALCISSGGTVVVKGKNEARCNCVELFHDVPNVAWVVRFKGGCSLIYATDTSRIDHIKARDLDWYFIEANYTDDEIDARIEEKLETGEYIYEYRARNNHLSKEKADRWLADNAGEHSQFVYMHIHGGD